MVFNNLGFLGDDKSAMQMIASGKVPDYFQKAQELAKVRKEQEVAEKAAEQQIVSATPEKKAALITVVAEKAKAAEAAFKELFPAEYVESKVAENQIAVQTGKKEDRDLVKAFFSSIDKKVLIGGGAAVVLVVAALSMRN